MFPKLVELLLLGHYPIWFLFLGLILCWKFKAATSRGNLGTFSFSGLWFAFFTTELINLLLLYKTWNSPQSPSGMYVSLKTLIACAFAWPGYAIGLALQKEIRQYRPNFNKPTRFIWFEHSFGLHWMFATTWLALTLPHFGAMTETGWQAIHFHRGIFGWSRVAEIVFLFHAVFIFLKLRRIDTV